jgi:hypothetical protein
MLKRSAFVLAIAACGGSAPKAKEVTMVPPPPPAMSECAKLADHVAGLALTFKDPPPTTKDVIADLLRTRCEADGWSADAKTCFRSIANEQDAEKCIATLTEDQRGKVMVDAKAKFGKPGTQGEDPTTSDAAPPPPRPEPTGTKAPGAPAKREEGKMGKRDAPAKAPKPKAPPAKGGGGPVKGDPCEGGE